MKNCFKYFWRWQYYLKRPWKFFEDTWFNLKAGWQRATRGWANRDVWSLNSYFLEILPDMLKHLRENAYGYPGDDEFPTFESWIAYLEEMETHFRNANEEQTVQVNEFEKEYMSYPTGFKKCENSRLLEYINYAPEDLGEKWFAREMEINAWREEELKKGLEMFQKSFWALWD